MSASCGFCLGSSLEELSSYTIALERIRNARGINVVPEADLGCVQIGCLSCLLVRFPFYPVLVVAALCLSFALLFLLCLLIFMILFIIASSLFLTINLYSGSSILIVFPDLNCSNNSPIEFDLVSPQGPFDDVPSVPGMA